jgi:hypothetical protein
MIELVERLQKDPVIEAYKRDVDRTLIRENLKLTVTQRIEQLMELQRVAEEARRAGREAHKRA